MTKITDQRTAYFPTEYIIHLSFYCILFSTKVFFSSTIFIILVFQMPILLQNFRKICSVCNSACVTLTHLMRLMRGNYQLRFKVWARIEGTAWRSLIFCLPTLLNKSPLDNLCVTQQVKNFKRSVKIEHKAQILPVDRCVKLDVLMEVFPVWVDLFLTIF